MDLRKNRSHQSAIHSHSLLKSTQSSTKQLLRGAQFGNEYFNVGQMDRV